MRRGDRAKVLVYVSNLRLLGYFILVYFGEGSSSCDRGKTKSTPSPWTWNWSLTKIKNLRFSQKPKIVGFFSDAFLNESNNFHSIPELRDVNIYRESLCVKIDSK